VSVSGAELFTLPEPGSSRRGLTRLGVAATGLVASIGASVALIAVFNDRSAEFSDFAVFGGWQVYLVEAALVVAVLGGVLSFGTMTLRFSRAMRERSPNGRAVVLAALLPGLLIGSLVATPMRAAVSWASDHTAAADAARAQLSRMQLDSRLAPPLTPSMRPAAPPELAKLMLGPTDLAKGWYATSRPNATTAPISPEAAAHGATSSVHAILTAEHWSGTSWSEDDFLIEGQTIFPSRDAASSYVRSVWAHPDITCACPTTVGAVVGHPVGGVTVSELTSTSPAGAVRAAAFIVGGTMFTIALDGSGPAKAATPAELTRVLAAAVERANARG
jgi:hypothetical protein